MSNIFRVLLNLNIVWMFGYTFLPRTPDYHPYLVSSQTFLGDFASRYLDLGLWKKKMPSTWNSKIWAQKQRLGLRCQFCSTQALSIYTSIQFWTQFVKEILSLRVGFIYLTCSLETQRYSTWMVLAWSLSSDCSQADGLNFHRNRIEHYSTPFVPYCDLYWPWSLYYWIGLNFQVPTVHE